MPKAAFNPNGVILWEGASAIDGAPIVVIATGLKRGSRNGKTGAQVQTFILRADVAPIDALKTGADASICGDCPHRPILAKASGAAACYVRVFQAPRSVWAGFQRGIYRRVTAAEAAELFAGRDVRLGAYGDPAAAPFELWREITARAASRTGYTHQWRSADRRFASLTMASADSEPEARDAWGRGWRTFRVAEPGSAPIPGEARCPASKEAGQKTQCAACKACGGTTAKARASIVIWDHSTAGAAKARRFALTVNGRAAA
jgi:hypothetical protein